MRYRRQLLNSHPRLMTALFAGLLVSLGLPAHWSVVSRALIGWNVAAWSYLALMAWLVAKSSLHDIDRLAKREDNNAIFVLAVMSLAALLSLVAIVVELATARNVTGGLRLFHYAFTAGTVFGSWLLLGTIYTFHYAHLFYRAPPDSRPLRFPDEKTEPDYWDFLYFAFTIAVAVQTSDVSILSTPMRKAVLAQSVLCFVFNAAIIGLSINIAASLVGN